MNIKCVYKDNVITWAKSGGGQRKLYFCWDIVEGGSDGEPEVVVHLVLR